MKSSAFAGLAVLVLASCSLWGSISPVATGIHLTGFSLGNTTINLANLGAQADLVPSFVPANATNQSVVWSYDTSLVKVSSAGLVTGIGAGTTTVTGTSADGGLVASASVTVAAAGPGNPSISPTGGSGLGTAPTITITNHSSSPGADLYYTIDTRTPDATSIHYTGPFVLPVPGPSATVNIKVIAVVGSSSSGVVPAAYTFNGLVTGAPLQLQGKVSTLISSLGGQVDGITYYDGNLYYIVHNVGVYSYNIFNGTPAQIATAGSPDADGGIPGAIYVNQASAIATDGTYLYVTTVGTEATPQIHLRRINLSTGASTTLLNTSPATWGLTPATAAYAGLPEVNPSTGIVTDGTNLYFTYLNHPSSTYNANIYSVVSGGNANPAGFGSFSYFQNALFSMGGLAIDSSGLVNSEYKASTPYACLSPLGGASWSTINTVPPANLDFGAAAAGLYSDGTRVYAAGHGAAFSGVMSFDRALSDPRLTAGNSTAAAIDATGSLASFLAPTAITSDGVALYVGDGQSGTYCIRKIQ